MTEDMKEANGTRVTSSPQETADVNFLATATSPSAKRFISVVEPEKEVCVSIIYYLTTRMRWWCSE